MKLLIAYDGSDCSELALDDLAFAGLPDFCEACIVSVAETWMPLETDAADRPPNPRTAVLSPFERTVGEHELDNRALAEPNAFAQHAKRRLQQTFPDWHVSAETRHGSPARQILLTAEAIDADLIVVGSRGSSAVGRFLLGSISQKVITEAKCSVRVGRSRRGRDGAAERLVIGFDGSTGSRRAVDTVLKRNWPNLCEIRLIAAIEDVTSDGIGRFVPPSNDLQMAADHLQVWVERLTDEVVGQFQLSGIDARPLVCKGNPKMAVVDQAAGWNADCVYVGATQEKSGGERGLLGSTSAAIAARAPCSVEVVRRRPARFFK